MQKKFIFFLFLFAVAFWSCTNSDSTKEGEVKSEKQQEADRLKNDVDDGHDIGMAKMGKLTRAAQATQRLLDSISTLPVKARKAAEPLKIKLDSLKKELQYAEFAMDKWMKEYKWDSVFTSMESKIGYLTNEKINVTKVKEAILNGIQHADSLLKGKF